VASNAASVSSIWPNGWFFYRPEAVNSKFFFCFFSRIVNQLGRLQYGEVEE
jgi:hypothetical protein